jgi:parvulin-like peptidyl-prolyl isomerase
MKKAVSITICLMMIFVFAVSASACGSAKGGALLATVDGTKYYENPTKEFASFYLLWYYGQSLEELDETTQAQLIDDTALNMLIDYQVIKKYMGEKGVITDDQRKEIDDAVESFSKPKAGTETELTNKIKELGISKETMTTFFDFMYYQQAFKTKVNEDTPVSDAQIATYYEAHKAELIAPEAISLSHILMGSSEHTDADRAAAEAVLAEATAGADFAELAKEHSLDTSTASSGGDLGEVTRDGYDAAFVEAAFALKTGEISGVVESQYGFHIIKANSDIIPEHEKTLEEAREEIVSALQTENYLAFIAELRAKEKIKYDKGLEPNSATTPAEDDATE